MRDTRITYGGRMKSQTTESGIATRERLAKNLALLVVQALRREQQIEKHKPKETDQDTSKSKAETGHILSLIHI